MEQFELQASIGAPLDQVWALYTDHIGWQGWAGVREVVLRQQGDPPPNGLGAIRVVRQSGVAIEEEVTAFEPPERFAYRMVGGLPLRDYVGEVRFAADGAGTRVRWHVRFRPWIPGTGWLLRRLLQRGLSEVLERLALHAKRAA